MIIKEISHSGMTAINYDVAENPLGLSADLLNGAAKAELSAEIDTTAGTARAAFVSPGSLVEQEYHLAKQEASDWLANGKDESAIPSSVQDHMDMFGVGAETAANEIVTTAAQWEQALATIRRARLGGKTAVRSAETIEAAEQAAQAAIAQLNGIRPPKGVL